LSRHKFQSNEEDNIMMKTMLSAAVAALLATSAAHAGDWVTGDWVAGGGWVEGGGTGGAFAESAGYGDILDQESFARSETGFGGYVRFATDECGTCEEDTNAVFGEGFSDQFSGSFIQVEGGAAAAFSETYGGAWGEGHSWSARPAAQN
jgi:hypothetical protein